MLINKQITLGIASVRHAVAIEPSLQLSRKRLRRASLPIHVQLGYPDARVPFARRTPMNAISLFDTSRYHPYHPYHPCGVFAI